MCVCVCEREGGRERERESVCTSVYIGYCGSSPFLSLASLQQLDVCTSQEGNVTQLDNDISSA